MLPVSLSSFVRSPVIELQQCVPHLRPLSHSEDEHRTDPARGACGGVLHVRAASSEGRCTRGCITSYKVHTSSCNPSDAQLLADWTALFSFSEFPNLPGLPLPAAEPTDSLCLLFSWTLLPRGRLVLSLVPVAVVCGVVWFANRSKNDDGVETLVALMMLNQWITASPFSSSICTSFPGGLFRQLSTGDTFWGLVPFYNLPVRMKPSSSPSILPLPLFVTLVTLVPLVPFHLVALSILVLQSRPSLSSFPNARDFLHNLCDPHAPPSLTSHPPLHTVASCRSHTCCLMREAFLNPF